MIQKKLPGAGCTLVNTSVAKLMFIPYKNRYYTPTGLTLSDGGLEGFLLLVTYPSLLGPFNLYQSERNRAFNRFEQSTILVKVK